MKYFYTILFVSILCLAIVGITNYAVTQRSNVQANYFTTSSLAVAPTVSPTPRLLAPSPLEITTTQPSPDGTKMLSMNTMRTTSGASECIFTTMDNTKENKKQIYKELLPCEAFTIPFNAWSPDNSYLFIQKKSGEVLVFTRTGETITPTEQFMNVKDIFSQTERKDRYDVVTGWASPTLLIVNTVTPDGAKGSSYWFEIPSKAIIQLSGDF